VKEKKDSSKLVKQVPLIDLDYPIDSLNRPSPVEKFKPLSGASLAAVGKLELDTKFIPSDKLAEALR
jgi:hypothetical protein